MDNVSYREEIKVVCTGAGIWYQCPFPRESGSRCRIDETRPV